MAGGTNNVIVSNQFKIVYTGNTNTLSVKFSATNSADNAYPAADSDSDGMSDLNELMFGSDGVVSVDQAADGSRTIAWPQQASDGLDRTYKVWYTLNLMQGFQWLATVPNGTSYVDRDHAGVPVIYYKVTVE
jgi:hypothetical protein